MEILVTEIKVVILFIISCIFNFDHKITKSFLTVFANSNLSVKCRMEINVVH